MQSIRPHEKGLSSWRPTRAEIGDTRFNSGTEPQIGLAGKRGCWSSEQPAGIGAAPSSWPRANLVGAGLLG
jgi:hypothetical protein